MYASMLQTGLTALHFSILKNQLSTLRALVKEFNVDPNLVDQVSVTKCHIMHVYTLNTCMPM